MSDEGPSQISSINVTEEDSTNEDKVRRDLESLFEDIKSINDPKFLAVGDRILRDNYAWQMSIIEQDYVDAKGVVEQQESQWKSNPQKSDRLRVLRCELQEVESKLSRANTKLAIQEQQIDQSMIRNPSYEEMWVQIDERHRNFVNALVKSNGERTEEIASRNYHYLLQDAYMNVRERITHSAPTTH